MASTAEYRLAKRRINDLEQKLKKLQKEIREIKVEKKQIGSLRKQALRSLQIEADCNEILNDCDLPEPEKKEKSNYKCKNIECNQAKGYKNTENCTIIDVGTRLIVICQDCGSRYTVERSGNS